MEPEQQMMLPKGIVINTSNIYEEVASFPSLPPDKVWKYWRVYTTTNKKLQDPTARRLENFWWHVLGSDRGSLSGSLLARLYEDISLGPTFVPLKGPANRWEGPDALLLDRHGELAPNRRQEDGLKPSDKTQSKSDACLSREMPSSALRPPPSHPILKKPSGSSTSGTRPTARFVSPHVSGDEQEEDDQNDIPSSGSTITPGLEIRVPSISPPKKKAPTTTKKFVASAANAKKRPVLLRKPSSQTSGTAEPVSKQTGPVSDARSPRSVASAASSSGDRSLSHRSGPKPNSGGSAGSRERPQLSEKAAGKRPAISKRNSIERNGTAAKKPDPRSPTKPEVPSYLPTPSEPTMESGSFAEPAPTAKKDKRPSVVLNEVAGEEARANPFPKVRAASHPELPQRRESIPSKAPNQALFTGALASTSNVAAQGTIIDQSGSTVGSLPIPHHFGHHQFDDISPSSSLLDSHLTPTQPSASASVPLGRTKSQLTLLLEREKARAGNKPRSKS